jgi:hypothetical protein
MGTRCAIAEPAGDSWRGRYVHWDGNPTHIGPELVRMFNDVFRQDVAEMKRDLITEHPKGFSSLGDVTEATDGHTLVEHVGLAYNDGQDFWIEPEGDSADAQWAYVLNAHGVIVFRNRNGWKRVGQVAWSDGTSAGTWKRIEAAK